MRRIQVVAAVFGFVFGISLVGFALTPRVIERSPVPTAASAWPTVFLRFNRPLATNSFVAGIKLEPEVPGASWLQDNRLFFRPSQPLSYGRRYAVTVPSTLRGSNGLPPLNAHGWSFTVDRPRLVFLRQFGDEANLWIRDGVEEIRQLTHEPLGIWDYNVAPGGRGWIVSALLPDGGSDLLLIDGQEIRSRLLRCLDALCSDGRMRPDGRLLAYARQPSGSDLDLTEIWLLDLTTMATFPASEFGDAPEGALPGSMGRFPRWSPDGRYLAYFRPDLPAVVFLDFDGDRPGLVPANLELMGEWSPDGRQLAYTELAFGDRQPHEHRDESGAVISHTRPSLYRHVVIASPDEEAAVDLSQGQEFDEGLPAWSPDGKLLAVARSDSGAGHQIWLLAADGSSREQLTDDPFFHHSALAWSPDGQELAFMRRSLAESTAPVAIWLLDLDTDEMSLAFTPAFSPGWMP